MKIVVLAGGRGTRLGLADNPKALVRVGGVPLLERTVLDVVSCGFRDFIFLNGFLGEKIEDHFDGGERFGANIVHIRESEPLGTAGALNPVRDMLIEPFLVVYADILLDVDFKAFAEFALKMGGSGTLFAHPNDHPWDSDLLEVDSADRIVAVHPKPHAGAEHYPNLVSAALYFLTPRALDYVPRTGPSDWGKDIFPVLAAQTPLYAYRSCEYVKDVGTPERLARAERHLHEGLLERRALRTNKPAVFLDRDGVVNVERGGVHSPEEVELIPGAAEAIRSFNDAGVPVICATNQPDLAKGMMSWGDLRAVTGEIDHQLASAAGAYIDDLLVCPHHPEAGWPGEVPELKIACDCRKPLDGLLRRARQAHNIDLARSWMVGDRYCDIAAAASAGTRSILVSTGHNGNDRANYSVEPDMRCADLVSASRIILDALA